MNTGKTFTPRLKLSDYIDSEKSIKMCLTSDQRDEIVEKLNSKLHPLFNKHLDEIKQDQRHDENLNKN
jgi:hypothetical protein